MMWSQVLAVLLGLVLLTLGFFRGFDAKSIILCVFMLLIGADELWISMNKEGAGQERIEESDERNRLSALTFFGKACRSGGLYTGEC